MNNLVDRTVEESLARVRAWLGAEKRLLIGGDWVPAQGGAEITVVDPSNGRVLGAVPAGGAADIDAAVAAARQAFHGPWRQSTPSERQRLLHHFASLVEQHYDDLALLETLDLGVPYARSFGKRDRTVAQLEFYSACAGTVATGTRVDAVAARGVHGWIVREPVGVVGAIAPWNSPIMSAIWKIGPVLATGCTMVLKPAEETPLVALRLGELLAEAGMPDGVVNIVTGDGPGAGAALAAHPGVDKIAFTGSTETASHIVRASAENFKRLSLELGGKSPNIIFADADLDRAVPAAAMAAFTNSGQICTAGTRLYVERAAYDDVLERVAGFTRALVVGPGIDPTTDIGPLVSKAQQDRVVGYLERAVKAGARVVCGGDVPLDERSQGFYVMPTMLDRVDDGMEVCREEVFGPVVVVQAFDSVDEVVARANSTAYGLAGGVWTADLHKASRVISGLSAGIVWLNAYGVMDPALPFGGTKASGYGRESGLIQLDDYVTHKTIVHQQGSGR